ncbi:MAG: (d)CMP kinase [Acidaminococcus sp.]|nr:(d)CMP kinase [Acidaminococcus sp.]MCI2099463.1 (d)CMP kinase [Acidaminococcus sp.]MCI2113823.1 (d)CMP kinase [Acidaminococcus sp.]MCI2115603.1 (d)CMP kinase [Acidaminococcus sp.]
MKQIIIAIDGPAGAGKSTIAKKVAAKLGYAYIDTGAMYRAVTLCFLQSGAPFSEDVVTREAETMDLSFAYKDGVNRVYVNGKEVTEAIRTLEVSRNVSKVSAVGGVRKAMVALQRKIGSMGGVVMDGRDIGTVVFPHAELKVFLTASVEERAHRRYLELKEKGEDVDLEDLKKRIAERDHLDETREIAPLRKADDAVLVDSTTLSIDEVTAKIVALAERNGVCGTNL